ncbi:MAG TPA: hypothetical protein VFB45_20485 [Pseudolabrys sp.]|nr:hypothetical protein [Pseudolabrys sp.]
MAKLHTRTAPFSRMTLLCVAGLACSAADAEAWPLKPNVVHPLPVITRLAMDTSALAPFPSELAELVRDATEARTFAIARSSPSSPAHSIATATISDFGALSAPSLDKLRKLLLSPESYQPAGLAVARRFVPTYGFRFSNNGREAWWLIADDGRLAAGMLVTKDTEWSRSPTLVIREPARRAFQALRMRSPHSG